MPNAVILSALVKLQRVPQKRVLDLIGERLTFTRRTQDSKLPNAGTVFKKGWGLGSELLGLRIGGAMFSTLTPNWIVNDNHGSSKDCHALIDHAKDRHREAGLTLPELEWIAW
jgi:UDP-N-acetylenolpyruvoylglucosamine reductase